MKRQVELAILGGLILFMSFTPGIAPVRAFLSTPIGRAVGLAVVVYVFKAVSPAIGLLLAIHVARCSRMVEGIDDTLTEPVEMCECDPDFTYNTGTKMCEKTGSPSRPPARCACLPGTAWDATEKTCKPKPSVESAPPVVPPESMPSMAGADVAAVAAEGAALPPSSVPETTGAAAGAAMASASSSTPPPATEQFSPMDSPMIRGKQYSPW
jgi:hypothetical protein